MIPEFDKEFSYTDYDRGFTDDIEECSSRFYIMENEPEPEEELSL